MWDKWRKMIFCTWNTKHIHFGRILLLFIKKYIYIYIFLLKITFFKGINLLFESKTRLIFHNNEDTLNYFQFYNNIHLLLLSLEHTIQILRISKVLQSFTDTNIDFHIARKQGRNRKFSRLGADRSTKINSF